MINELTNIKSIIKENYDLGEVIKTEKLSSGYVNVSYIIETSKGRYFLRRYRDNARRNEVNFEHELINHLINSGFQKTPRLLKTKTGKTYVSKFEKRNNYKKIVFYALFEFAIGEDKYTWYYPYCNILELKDAAKTLAEYHIHVKGFKPKSKKKTLPLDKLIFNLRKEFENLSKKADETDFCKLFLSNKDKLKEKSIKIYKELKAIGYATLPKIVVFGDFHLGNLKFKDNKVTAMYDFDWVKWDARAYDVAYAIYYTCGVWGEKGENAIDVNKALEFFKAYQKTFIEKGKSNALNEMEIKALPALIKAVNLFLIHWDISDFYAGDKNVSEYLKFLIHDLDLMDWLTVNKINFNQEITF
ncbi:phosphotransferase [Candidatus Bathyarchaeota archaeon]|nr:phosphotransferase [Candidatus Bathyarchaeota archaeon]